MIELSVDVSTVVADIEDAVIALSVCPSTIFDDAITDRF